MSQVTFGIFNNREHTEAALNELEDAGYNPKEVSIIMKDTDEAREISDHTGGVVAGATTGATTGGAIGALAGLLVGIGAITVPGIGGLLVGGPLVAALGLTGAAASTVSGAVTGALAGGIIGGLLSLGIPEADAKVYERGLQEGGILLAVPSTEGTTSDAKSILAAHGAQTIRTVSLTDKR